MSKRRSPSRGGTDRACCVPIFDAAQSWRLDPFDELRGETDDWHFTRPHCPCAPVFWALRGFTGVQNYEAQRTPVK